MSEKAIRMKAKKFRKVAGKGENLRVIKIGKTDAGIRTVTFYKKIFVKPPIVKSPLLDVDLSASLAASPIISNSGSDSKPPRNPNRRPTHINADRSLSRMKARDRALIGRGY
ncbi:hypothetical protein BHE17_11870 [Planococcus maritimus]|uniref:hypothetical protein n=1 Tax=Planococcus maritimus TaxID=192421 RepID=UPI00084CE4C7|nr:hypothetical protein [Planococcus maritimus]OED33110.1 hypothetical protein BHE17_11870 [Planococcus maritimus]